MSEGAVVHYPGTSISDSYVWLHIKASLPQVARLNRQQRIAVREEGKNSQMKSSNNDPGNDVRQNWYDAHHFYPF